MTIIKKLKERYSEDEKNRNALVKVDEIVLKALCAYRDEIIETDGPYTDEQIDELSYLVLAVSHARSRIDENS